MLLWCRGQSSETFDLRTRVQNPSGAPRWCRTVTKPPASYTGVRRLETCHQHHTQGWHSLVITRRPAKSVGPRPSQVQILLLAPYG